VLNLINGRTSFSYSELTVALVNLVLKKNKEYFISDTGRGIDSEKKLSKPKKRKSVEIQLEAHGW